MTTEVQHRRSLPALSSVPQYDLILLDGSSSMQGQWWDVLAALDSYVDELKSNNTKTLLTLSIFTTPDENCEMIARENVPSSDWTPLCTDPVGSHWRMTNLFDAIHLGCRRLREVNPERAHLIIATDGEENSSSFTDETQARAMLDWARSKGYQVTFIGCDFDNSSTARALGANPAEAIGVSKARLADATRELGKKRSRHAASGAPIHWSEEEQQKFGGYLGSR